MLEKEEDISNVKPYAQYAGFGNANDAFHPSSLSAEGNGPYLAMKAALDSANIESEKIDYINAHGTGTENNDESESRAMIRLFVKPPAFGSTKSNTGHTLGGAGAVEAVYSILSLVNNEGYPNLGFRHPIDSTQLEPIIQYSKLSINHIMSNSFGFGGNCTSIIFSKA